jgi:malate dehydrogenase (oxaloacetate-decarboxylating)/malate dehydrogenase (oxaloacetate-decarboxylating)(NADP+)
MALVSAFATPGAATFSRAFAVCKGILPLKKTGIELLRDPSINKGTGFTAEERDRLHLRGLLPHKVFTVTEQVARVQRQFEALPTPLLKYVYLSNEREKNEQVFWRFLYTYPPEFTMPVL